jgi:hypothetical protein
MESIPAYTYILAKQDAASNTTACTLSNSLRRGSEFLGNLLGRKACGTPVRQVTATCNMYFLNNALQIIINSYCILKSNHAYAFSEPV